MKELQKARKEFDKTFNLKFDIYDCRAYLSEEYIELQNSKNDAEKWDALIDMAYVLMQCVNNYGYDEKVALLFPLDRCYQMFMHTNEEDLKYRATCLLERIKIDYYKFGFCS